MLKSIYFTNLQFIKVGCDLWEYLGDLSVIYMGVHTTTVGDVLHCQTYLWVYGINLNKSLMVLDAINHFHHNREREQDPTTISQNLELCEIPSKWWHHANILKLCHQIIVLIRKEYNYSKEWSAKNHWLMTTFSYVTINKNFVASLMPIVWSKVGMASSVKETILN